MTAANWHGHGHVNFVSFSSFNIKEFLFPIATTHITHQCSYLSVDSLHVLWNFGDSTAYGAHTHTYAHTHMHTVT